MNMRTSVLGEARFSFQNFQAGRPGKLFGTPALSILETPWPSASSGDLIARMELDNCLYGNSYWVKDGQYLVRLDPTKVLIHTMDVIERISGKAYGKQLLGYSVIDKEGNELGYWLPNEIIHYRPMPDPNHRFRGLSWLATILPDISADQGMTNYKNSYLRNAATPSIVVTYDKGVSEDAFLKAKEKMAARHTGTDNAFKIMHLGFGADVKTIGSNFQELLFNDVQAAGETRIASAAGVPPSLLSLSEGMKGSALNAMTYTATRRRFADITVRPLWRSMCDALSILVPPPHAGSRLWYDERDIVFLQADAADASAVRVQDATAIRTLTDGGYDPETVIQAVVTGDLSLLKHTGYVSVQLQLLGADPALDPAKVPTDTPQRTP
jgi:HK97 family phage portal protein